VNTGVVTRTPARVRPGWHRTSLVALAVAVVAGLAMQAFGSVDPVNQMLSDTVAAWPGALLLGLACAALVVVAGCLAIGAGPAGSVRARVLHALLALWAAGLVAVAVFPTNLPGTELTDTAVLHRYGAALAAAVPPVIGLLVAASRRLRTAAQVTAGATLLYGAAHGPAVLFGADVLPYAGLAERILFALILVVLALTARDLAGRAENRERASWT
jgi:hypothetical protein